MRISHLTPVLLIVCTSPAAAWDFDCKFSAERQASIDTAGAERVEIAARGGTLDVRPATGARLLASGTACASREEYLAETQVHARRKGNVVQVFVQVPDEMKGIGTIYATLDLEVQVPAGLPVEVTDTSGNTTIEKVRITRFTDSSGDLVVRDLPVDVEINDSSGDIEIEQVSGSVRIENDSSGDIQITEVGRDVEVLADSSGRLEISRVEGSVRRPER